MHNPPHPGEFIVNIYLDPNGISGRELAAKLDVAASTLSRILKGASRVTPEMALRLLRRSAALPKAGSPCRMLMTVGCEAAYILHADIANYIGGFTGGLIYDEK